MYDINNCVLIRATDIFPNDGVIKTPVHNKAYSFCGSYYLESLLKKRFKSMNMEYPPECNVLFETKRSTVHFTINGLVTNSLYGRFNYPFIILEPLKHHISEKSLLSLRVEDTYFNDDINLSSDSIIMIDEAYFEKIKNEVDLSKYNIRVYSGNREDALKNVLEELGYPYFEVCDHGYREGMDSNSLASKMFSFIRDFASANGIEQERHFYSDVNYDDATAREINAKEYSKKHLLYILDSGLVYPELSEKIKTLLDTEEDELEPLLERLVNSIDLDKLKELTKKFNEIEEEKLKSSTTKELL